MDGNDSRRIDRLEAILRATHACRPQPPQAPGLAAAVLASLKAEPVGTAVKTRDSDSERLDRLEDVLRQAHARRLPPPLDPGMAASVLAVVRAEAEAEASLAPESGLLWRMAAGAGLLAAATVLFALTFGSGLEEEVGRLLLYDPSGQVVVSLLGV
jgi:hypothetical protein